MPYGARMVQGTVGNGSKPKTMNRCPKQTTTKWRGKKTVVEEKSDADALEQNSSMKGEIFVSGKPSAVTGVPFLPPKGG